MSYASINFASTPTAGDGSLPSGWISPTGATAAALSASVFRSQSSNSAVWLHSSVPVPTNNEIVGQVTISTLTASDSAGGAIMTAGGSGYSFLVRTGDIRVFKTTNNANGTLTQVGSTQVITGAVGDIIRYSYNKSTGAIRVLQNGTVRFTATDTDHLAAELLLGVLSRSAASSVSVVSLHGVVGMADAYVNFSGLPNSSPATIPAGFEIVPGKLNSGIRINSGRLEPVNETNSGLITLSPISPVNGVITSEITLARTDSDYLATIRIYFDGGLSGYSVTGKTWSWQIRRHDVTGAVTNIGAAFSASQTNAGDRMSFRYTPATGALTLHRNDIQLLSATNTVNVGTSFKSAVELAGYNTASTSISSLNFNNVNQYTLTNLNDGNPVVSGQTNIAGSLLGFSALPTITCTYANGTKSIPIINVNGTAASFTFTLGDRIDNSNCPLDGTTLTFVFTNGAETISGTLLYAKKAGEVSLVFANAVTDDSSYLSYHIAAAGFTANGGTLYYTVPGNMSDLVIDPDGTVSVTNSGNVSGWFIPLTGTGAGTAQELNILVKDSGIVQYGVANSINTSRFPTATGITVDGVATTAFSGSNNSYLYTVPSLAAGIRSPRPGSRTLSITNGTITDNFDVTVQVPSTQAYVTLTTGGTGAGFVGNYLACVAGDYIVFDTPTTLGVTANLVTVSGAIQTDYSGTQTMWHISSANGMVTELTVSTPVVAVDFVLNPTAVVGGIQNTLTTALISTANALTINGRSISTLAGTGGTFTFTVPTLTAGNSVPLFNAATTVSITDGTTTLNGTASYIPEVSKTFVTLTSVVNTIGYIGYYIPGCAIGDQIVFDKPATRSVAVNSIGADGRLQTDYHGTQTAYHISASTGNVTELTIVTPEAAFDVVPNNYTFSDTTDSPLSTTVESNTITVAGVDAGQNIPVTITGGEYAVNTGSGFGAWTTANTNVQLGWTIKVRGTSSAQFATATNVVLSVGGVADTFTINTITADVTPNPFSFTSVTNAQLSSTSTSASVSIIGFSTGTPISISISNGTYSIDGGAYTATTGTITVNQTVSVRVTTPATELTPTVATLTIGGVTGTFTATTRAYDVVPTAFSFTTVTDTALSAVTDSNSITVAGIDGGASANISISGGLYSINGGSFTATAGTVQLGQSVTVRVTAANAYATNAVAALTIGGVTGTFTVTTRAADITPTAFSFTAVNNAVLSSQVESNAITIAGVDSGVNVPVSVTNGEYSVYNGSSWSAFTTISGNVQLGYQVKVRTTAAAVDGQSVNTTLSINGISATFTVSTGAVDLAPTAFSFTAFNNAEPNALLVSNAITVAGISAGYDTPVSVTNGEYRFYNGISWSNYTAVSGNVRLGYQVQVRHSASAAFNTAYTTTLNIGGVSATYVSTTRVAITLPTSFVLGSQTSVSPSTYYEAAAITVAGVDAGVPINLTLSNGEYSIDDAAWSSADTTVQLGASIKIRLQSDSGFAATTTTTLNIGGRSSIFTLTTRNADVTPNVVTFTANTASATNTVIVSNPVTMSGMDPSIDVSYSVTNGDASIHDGTAWGAYAVTGMVRNGYQVRLRTTSPSFVNLDKVVTLAIGTSTSAWSVDTNASLTTVDPFTFNALTGATINTAFDSNLVTLSGMTKGTLTTVNISGGKYRAFYRNMATGWLSGSTQLPFGSEIQVRIVTTNNYSTQHSAVLTIAGYSATFSVTTKVPNTTPRSFVFNTIDNAVKSTPYESNIAIIKGFDLGIQANISIANGEYRLDTGSGFGAWTSTPGTAPSGSVVKVRTTAPTTAETTKLVTLTVNGATGVFTVITRKDPVVHTADDVVGDFSIAPVVNAEPLARIESSSFTVTDIDSTISIPITVTNGEYSINNGPWTTAVGKVSLGNTVRVSGRCKAGYNAVNEVMVSVGSLTRNFMISTRAELTTLNAVAFYSVTKAPINTEIESNIITISGIDSTYPVTLSTSGGLKYRVDAGLGFGEWLTTDSVVGLGNRIQTAVTSSGQYETLRIGTLVMNGSNVQFRVTTGAEPVLSVFSSIARKVNTRRYRLTK